MSRLQDAAREPLNARVCSRRWPSRSRHRDRSREFLAEGGVPRLAERMGLELLRTKVVAGGNMGI